MAIASEAETRVLTPSQNSLSQQAVAVEAEQNGENAENTTGNPNLTEPSQQELRLSQVSAPLSGEKLKAKGLSKPAGVGLGIIALLVFIWLLLPKSTDQSNLSDSTIASRKSPLQHQLPQQTQPSPVKQVVPESEAGPDEPSAPAAIPSTEKKAATPQQQNLYPLTVHVQPHHARIRILNIVPKYKPGMLLSPGEYILELTADNHIKKVETITLDQDHQTFEFALQRLESLRDPLASGGYGPAMVIIPVQEFTMGCTGKECPADARPAYPVRFQHPFAIGKTEVTFEQFDLYARRAGVALPKDNGWGRGSRPVINVSWSQAKHYADWLSEQTGQTYRLPSEAEWTFAAAAGAATPYVWGKHLPPKHANCAQCGSPWSGKSTAPVGSFEPTTHGLLDMFGNVWEWTEDCLHKNFKGAPVNGLPWKSGDCDYRILKGGSYSSPKSNLKILYRNWNLKRTRKPNYGFRLIRLIK